MMFDVHPLHPSRPSPSQKLNRENRIKNACLSNSHSNIAASNDKRPLFVQIPATSSASLVSTSLPIQCLRLSNFFFFRRIFADNFLPNLLEPPPQRIPTTSERIRTTSLTYSDHLGTYSNTFGTCRGNRALSPKNRRATRSLDSIERLFLFVSSIGRVGGLIAAARSRSRSLFRRILFSLLWPAIRWRQTVLCLFSALFPS